MDKKLLELIRSEQYVKFYKSREWRQTRKEVMERDNNECQHCKRQGKFSHGECVHHIIHLKDNPYLALDKNNLITLCNSCHNKEHPEKAFKYTKDKRIEIPERW